MTVRRWWLAAALVGALSCGDDPGNPVPGTIEVVLAGPGPAVGAVLFLIEGGSVDTVESAGAYLDAAPYSGVATQVLVAGDDLRGVIARARVPDLRVGYTAFIQQVADSRTYALRPPEETRVFIRAAVP
ncbi:MAG: hypothetical protein SF070_07920 [Gemmatimonadota bacterium]|nr:hypothetical protein [Gemmatimonadota bacterium]